MCAHRAALLAIGKDNKSLSLSLFLSDLGNKKGLFFCCVESDSKSYIR